MSVRKIKKSYISCTGYFKSYKNQNQIAFESVLERNFYLLLEFDITVESYCEQPFTLYYDLFGKRTKYTPDSLVTYVDQSQKVYEIKYIKEINDNKELQNKIELLHNVISEQKFLPFAVFTDNDFNDIYLKNAQFLYPFAFLEPDDKYMSKINNLLHGLTKNISIQELLNLLSSKKQDHLIYLPYIWHIIFNNINLVDMNHKLTMNTIIKGIVT